jgi:hypothetical protein
VGTAPGRHRGRAPDGRARPVAHDLPLEGRRPHRHRAAGQDRRLIADPWRPAQAPGDGGTVKLRGEPLGAPWEALGPDGSDDWEFTSAAKDSPDQLYALWDGAVERSRARLSAALADGGLDQLVHVSGPDGRHASLRRLVCDLIEEYGRHTGHADLLREAVDGLTGEDPPAGWHAKAGQYRVDS